MIEMTIDDILEDIIAIEGGYVDIDEDRGGKTKYGITLATLREWYGRPVSGVDLQALTRDEALEILRQQYVERPGLMDLPTALQPFMCDFAVHSGPKTAIRTLQREVGTAADGVLGPDTEESVRTYISRTSESDLLRRLVEARLVFLSRIVARDATQAMFFVGWVRRVTRFI